VKPPTPRVRTINETTLITRRDERSNDDTLFGLVVLCVPPLKHWHLLDNHTSLPYFMTWIVAP